MAASFCLSMEAMPILSAYSRRSLSSISRSLCERITSWLNISCASGSSNSSLWSETYASMMASRLSRTTFGFAAEYETSMMLELRFASGRIRRRSTLGGLPGSPSASYFRRRISRARSAIGWLVRMVISEFITSSHGRNSRFATRVLDRSPGRIRICPEDRWLTFDVAAL